MRKVNYASYVKRTMPLRDQSAERYTASMGIITAFSVDVVIDIQHIEAYLSLRSIEAVHGETKTTGPEERGAGAGRCPQSQPRSRSPRSVHQQPILPYQPSAPPPPPPAAPTS